MNTSFIAVIGFLILLVIVLIVLVVRLGKRMERFTKGSNAVSLESIITQLVADQAMNVKNHQSVLNALQQINNRVKTSTRGFAVTRFNAYENTGGNQSYCYALLDENGRGMVLSSLYSRERSNTFAKPIVNFACEFELTAEEKQVLEKATASLGLTK